MVDEVTATLPRELSLLSQPLDCVHFEEMEHQDAVLHDIPNAYLE